jgi:rhamnose transport system substrate-binding protein
MRFNRRFTAIAAIGLTAALVLAGCTKKNEESSGTTAPAGGGATSAASGSAGGGGDTGKTYKVAFVPKLQGIPYFEAMNAGGKEAEAALGNVQWLYQGPTQADAAAQADIVRTFIQQKVDTLFIAPNDPDSMAPLIKQGIDAGIKVGTSDTDAPNSERQAMVLMATAEGIGKANTDALMKAMGGKGKFAIVSCGETATNLNQWIDEIKKYSAEKYPDASIVDVVYAGEDVAKATQMGTDLMNAHPDMTGMVGVCSTAGPGIAQAVANANKIGKVYTVGMGTPNDMKKYLESGAASAGVLWDAKALGYLTAWAGVQMAEGKPFQATQKVADGALENVTWDESTKTLLMGDPLTFTKETVGNYNF